MAGPTRCRPGSTTCCSRWSREWGRNAPTNCSRCPCRPSAVPGSCRTIPIEQYIRDAKIDSLYEGTTAIQGMDLFFRKIIRDNGAAMRHLLGEITEFAAAEAGNGRLKLERAALARAVTDVEGMLTAMTGFLAAAMDQPAEIYRVGLNTNRLLLALGDLLIGWLLARQAEVAMRGPGHRRRQGQGLLPREDRRRAVLRRHRAAPARRRARDRRADQPGPDGAPRSRLLIAGQPSARSIRPVVALLSLRVNGSSAPGCGRLSPRPACAAGRPSSRRPR